MLHAFSRKDGISFSRNWIEDLTASHKVKPSDLILQNPSPLLVKKLYWLKRKNFLAFEGGYSENPHQTQKNGFLDPPKRVLVV